MASRQKGFNRDDDQHVIERSLYKAVSPLGKGWGMEVVEAVTEIYKIDFSDNSEQNISEIESALRDILGTSGDIFIDRFYSELKGSGLAL